jgi:hypothetical protein
MSKLNQLLDALTETDHDVDDSEEINKADLMVGKHRKDDDENTPADLGEWDIAKLDDKVVLKIEDFKVTVDLGEDGIDKILDAIADGSITSVKCDGARVTFRPTNRAKDYVVKIFGNTKYPNGILLDHKSIDKLSEIVGS